MAIAGNPLIDIVVLIDRKQQYIAMNLQGISVWIIWLTNEEQNGCVSAKIFIENNF